MAFKQNEKTGVQTKSPECKSLGRRLFLKTTAVCSLLASIPTSLWSFFIDKMGIRTVEKDTFAFELPKKSVFWKMKKDYEPYVLVIDGLVKNKCGVSFNELLKLPQCSQVSDFHCVEG